MAALVVVQSYFHWRITSILQWRVFTGDRSGISKRGPSQGYRNDNPQKLKQNVKLAYNFCFPVHKLRFNEYWSRAWTVFLYKHTIQKNSEVREGFESPNCPVPLWVRQWLGLLVLSVYLFFFVFLMPGQGKKSIAEGRSRKRAIG